MILVTGGTGNIGTELVKMLAAKGEKVRVLARDASKAKKVADKNVEFVSGDLLKPDSIRAAFQGADKVFLLGSGPDLPKLDANGAEAAKQAGVKHIVKLSVIGADMEPGIAMGRWHREGEKKVMATGIPWAFLRPSGFMTNAFGWASTIKSQGAFYQPTGDGKMGFIDPRDIAAVAAAVLTGKGHESKAYSLTGPEALSGGEMAAKLSAGIGKPVKYVDVPAEAAQKSMQEMKMPPLLIDGYLELFGAVKAGYTAAITDTVKEVTGKAPRTFDAWVKENAAAFK